MCRTTESLGWSGGTNEHLPKAWKSQERLSREGEARTMNRFLRQNRNTPSFRKYYPGEDKNMFMA